MQQIGNQAFKLQLFVGVLCLSLQFEPVPVNKPVEAGIVVEVCRNESFITAMRLVVQKLAGLIGLAVQQRVDGIDTPVFVEKSKAIFPEKRFDVAAECFCRFIRFEFVPEIRRVSEFAEGNNCRVGVIAEFRRIPQKLLGNLFDLLIAGTEQNIYPNFILVKRRRKNDVLKACRRNFAKLFLVSQ